MGADTSRAVADFRHTLTGQLAPVREHLATIDKQIAELEAELADLREVRRVAQRILTAVDGPPPKKPGPRPPSKTGEWRISEDRLAEIGAVLEDMGRDPRYRDGFTTKDVQPRIGMHKSSVPKVLNLLRERGFLRLDHMGGPRGKTNYWKLTGE